ncbi:MAG: hypothetical protein N3F10_06295, partial [Candidatus Bathyarchaeota archaeon]|nr:hypothetical protein [Candidatus Bathyarchaeota archaeon]
MQTPGKREWDKKKNVKQNPEDKTIQLKKIFQKQFNRACSKRVYEGLAWPHIRFGARLQRNKGSRPFH